MMRTTIVTMFYNIRKHEGSLTTTNRQASKYLELAEAFILRLPYPIIVFLDDDDKDTEEVVTKVREREGLLHLTHLYKIKLERTHFYKDLETIQRLQETFIIKNLNTVVDSPTYVILNNNKFDFIEKAIELNPFQSSHFMWMDFGINHVAKNPELIHTWFLEVPDKIKQLCINPYIENVEPKEHFQFIYHNTAGGLFSGSIANLLQYATLFKEKTEQIYKEEWYQLDEAVMTVVQRENPDLFDFFYGDYEGIISNYLIPTHSWWLISSGMRKCLNFNNTKFLYQILKYLECYISLSHNQTRPEFYEYLNNSIICDYYQNNHELRDTTIQFINEAIERNDCNVKNLLERNTNNLAFYSNKHLICNNYN